ncbi:hypothetical protein BDR07DRAFT_1414272 [Suillus spraguei]|nr:hypothetical protein BDR07DRAFT_1414272 [Suillus spraguei]
MERFHGCLLPLVYLDPGLGWWLQQSLIYYHACLRPAGFISLNRYLSFSNFELLHHRQDYSPQQVLTTSRGTDRHQRSFVMRFRSCRVVAAAH